MSEALSRAFAADIEVRADGTGRTVHGIIVPFGRVARVSDGGPFYDEMFERGAFSKTIRERGDRVKLLSQHMTRNNPLGRATLLREEASGLYGEFHVSKTAAGDEALELLRDGALDSFSVGFSAIKHVKRSSVTVRTEVGLREASLVTFPAYADALVGGIRGQFSEDELAELARMVAEHTNLRSATPDGEPADLGTSEDAARAEDEPLDEHSARHTTTSAFRFAAALRERGL